MVARAISSLGTRDYRLFFVGQLVSMSGTWMQTVGQAFLVLRLTDSGAVLGLTVAARFGPMFVLGPWGGLVADRLDKRRVLYVTQALSGVLALAFPGAVPSNKEGRRKIVHKMKARRYLPAAIVNRKKKGFPIPFGAWSRDALRPRVESTLLETLPQTGLFDRRAVEKLWRQHLSQSQPLDRQIYALFILGCWFERFQAGSLRASAASLASAA